MAGTRSSWPEGRGCDGVETLGLTESKVWESVWNRVAMAETVEKWRLAL